MFFRKPHTIFADRVAELGGCAKVSDWPCEVIMHGLEKYQQGHLGGPRVYSGLVANDRMNACCFREGRWHFLALYRGLAQKAWWLATTALKHPSVFSDVCSLPADDLAARDDALVFVLDLCARGDPIPLPEPTLPDADSRSALANQVGIHMLHFIAAHEFAHVLWGHLDWLSSFGVQPYLQAQPYSVNIEQDALRLMSLEYHADYQASLMSLAPVFHTTDWRAEPRPSIDGLSIKLNLRTWLFAVGLFLETMKFVSHGDILAGIGRAPSHPLPNYRWVCILDALAESCQRIFDTRGVPFDDMRRVVEGAVSGAKADLSLVRYRSGRERWDESTSEAPTARLEKRDAENSARANEHRRLCLQSLPEEVLGVVVTSGIGIWPASDTERG